MKGDLTSIPGFSVPVVTSAVALQNPCLLHTVLRNGPVVLFSPPSSLARKTSLWHCDLLILGRLLKQVRGVQSW